MNLHAIGALAGFTARRVFSGKRLTATLVLLLIPPAIAGVLALIVKDHAGLPCFFDQLMFNLSLYIVLMLTAMIHGIALSSGEIQDGTAGYLLMGACPRWLVALLHVAVTSVILGVLTAASIALTYAVSSLSPWGVAGQPPSAILADSLVAWIGLTAYLAFFVFCGYAFRHSVAVSVASVLLWEFLIAELPLKFASYTVVVNLRVIWLHLTQQGERLKWFQKLFGTQLPEYGEASMFLSVAVATFLTLALVAVMNRSMEGREAA